MQDNLFSVTRYTAMIVILGFTSSIANGKTYIEPEDGNVAKLRIINSDPVRYFMSINIADPETCKVGLMVGWLNGGRKIDTRRVDMLDPQPVKEGMLERNIPAGKSLSFVPMVTARLNAFEVLTSMGPSRGIVRDKQASACETPVFSPVRGSEYELIYNPAPSACTVSLNELTKSADGQVVRTEISNTVTRWISPVLGTYFRGVPKAVCR